MFSLVWDLKPQFCFLISPYSSHPSLPTYVLLSVLLAVKGSMEDFFLEYSWLGKNGYGVCKNVWAMGIRGDNGDVDR